MSVWKKYKEFQGNTGIACRYRVTASVEVLTLESETDLESSRLERVQSATFFKLGPGGYSWESCNADYSSLSVRNLLNSF